MDLGFYSYLSAALGFGFLAVMLLFSWRSSLQGRLLTVVVIVSALWAGVAAFAAYFDRGPGAAYFALELLRYVAWFAFLLKLFEPAAKQLAGYRFLRRWGLWLSLGFAALLLLTEIGVRFPATTSLAEGLLPVRLTGHLLLAMTGLALIEQLFRNIAPDYRYNLKFLFIGAGGLFAYDFYLYADALLFMGIDTDLWAARGFVNLISVPLLTIAAARNRKWSPNIFVSRDIVFYTTTVMGGGLYLLVMAAAGYYLQQFGGSWGRIAQVAFLSLAIVFLFVVLFSGQLRRQLRVFIVKHFYRNKYDYRLEWLHLTDALYEQVREANNLEASIRVLAQFVDAPGGQLWLDDGQGRYRNLSSWRMQQSNQVLSTADPLIAFIANKSYVVNLTEIGTLPEEYGQLRIPEWLEATERAWLVVPLPGIDSLPGFVVLTQSDKPRTIDWEDRDLLKTAARQVASHLAVLMTTDALAQARQFEVFNRLSSYMVHDLKNIAAGLEMVARNANKHRDNPEFLSDAFDSVAAASADIKRLLDQLRNKRIEEERKVLVDLVPLVEQAAEKLSSNRPVPEVNTLPGECHVVAQPQRLENMLVHLMENAQQATNDEGYVRVAVEKNGQFCEVAIEDNGHGMDDAFIQNRLFKPFDTTKGNAGMGIGMFESREYLRAMGGDIRVSSKPGAGTQIKLEIPLTVT